MDIGTKREFERYPREDDTRKEVRRTGMVYETYSDVNINKFYTHI